jgi:hypothetical protein
MPNNQVKQTRARWRGLFTGALHSFRTTLAWQTGIICIDHKATIAQAAHGAAR